MRPGTGDPPGGGTDDPVRPRGVRFVELRWALAAVVVVLTVGVAYVTTLIGACDAFGGRCPGEPEPLLDDDVAGSLFVTALVGGGLAALAAPVRTRWWVRALVVTAIAVLAGLYGATI